MEEHINRFSHHIKNISRELKPIKINCAPGYCLLTVDKWDISILLVGADGFDDKYLTISEPEIKYSINIKHKINKSSDDDYW